MSYFDSAATTFQKPESVRLAVCSAMELCASPGRGGYREAMRAAELVHTCRVHCAALFDCNPEQIVFTSGATQSLNAAIHDLVGAGDRVVVSGFEHNAVMRPLTVRNADIVVAGTALFDQQETLQAFERAVTEDTAAVICTHVSNVFGYILPVDGIAAICKKRHVPLIVDAAQSAGVLPVSLRKTGAAYIAVPGHKGLYGPQGIGILVCGKMPDRTLIQGGTGSLSRELTMPEFLPDRMEAGTMNVPGIAGLCKGVQFVEQYGMRRIQMKEWELTRKIKERLDSKRFQVFDGPDRSGVLSLRKNGEDCETTAARLAERGIAVRAGLHCAPLAHHSAGTLDTGTVRISVSVFNTEKETDRLIRVLCQ